MRPLAAADRLRSALLAAVGHDLRRPLAAATAAVTSLRSSEIKLSPSDRAELLETADESLGDLANLVTDLLDVSRLQAGVLGVMLQPVAVEEVVGDVLDELKLKPGRIQLELGETRPGVRRPGAAAARAREPARQRPSILAERVRTDHLDERIRRPRAAARHRRRAGRSRVTSRRDVRAVPAPRRHRQHAPASASASHSPKGSSRAWVAHWRSRTRPAGA